jgi:hypothetical protein
MQTRRQFVQNLIRGGIFSSLAFFSGIMTHRWIESTDCQNKQACGNCGSSNSCQLPEADQYRFNKAKLNTKKNVNESAGK